MEELQFFLALTQVWWGVFLVGMILLIIGLQRDFTWFNLKTFPSIILIIFGTILIIFGLILAPWTSIPAKLGIGQITVTPKESIEATPTPTPTPTIEPYPAAMAMKQYYDGIISADEYEFKNLYPFQEDCSNNSLAAYENFWIDFIPQYDIYTCSEENTIVVHTVFYDRATKQTANEEGFWVRYILEEQQDGWKIVECDYTEPNTLCDLYLSNADFYDN